MKKLLPAVPVLAFALTFLFMAALTYGATAFVLWEPWPGAWSEDTRFFVALAAFMLGGVCASAVAAAVA